MSVKRGKSKRKANSPLAQIVHYSEFHKTRHCSRGFVIRRVLSAALFVRSPLSATAI